MQLELCPGCMQRKKANEKICPICGYDTQHHTQPSFALPAGCMILNKYMVGKMISCNEYEIRYMGLDITLNKKVMIRELYISRHCVRDNSRSSRVVWKILPDQKDTACKEYLEEALKIRKLRSIRGIDWIRDAFEENNTALIISDLTEGKTFRRKIQSEGRMGYHQVVKSFLPFLENLQSLEKAGVIHGAISPSHILVKDDGTLVLSEMAAMTKSPDPEEKGGKDKFISDIYAPVECTDSRFQKGSWTDVYSVCAVLYYALMGKEIPPLRMRIASDIIEFGELSEPAPREALNAIARGLSYEPQNRLIDLDTLLNAMSKSIPQKADRFMDGLEQIQESENPEGVSGSAIDEAPRKNGFSLKMKRKVRKGVSAAVTIALTAVILLTASGLAAYYYHNKGIRMDGDCGPGAVWSLSGDGVLSINGSGDMDDYSFDNRSGKGDMPWSASTDRITRIVIEDGIRRIGSNAFRGLSALEDVQIPDSVEEIGQAAFMSCTKLGEARLGEGITVIEPYAFASCEMLTLFKMKVNSENGRFSLKNGVLYDGTGETLVCYPCGKKDKAYRIGENVTSVAKAAFFGAANLESITVEGSLQQINTWTFAGCTSLEKADLGQMTEVIGANAFYGCSALKEVYLPRGVTQVYDGAFAKAGEELKIWFAGEKPEMKKGVFEETKAQVIYGPAIPVQSLEYTVTEMPAGQSTQWDIGNMTDRNTYTIEAFRYMPESSEASANTIGIRLDKKAAVNGISISLGETAEENSGDIPTSFILYGRNKEEWVEVMNISDCGFTVKNGKTLYFTCEQETEKYREYRICFTGNKGGEWISFSELGFTAG